MYIATRSARKEPAIKAVLRCRQKRSTLCRSMCLNTHTHTHTRKVPAACGGDLGLAADVVAAVVVVSPVEKNQKKKHDYK